MSSNPPDFYRADVHVRLCTTSTPMNRLAKFIPAHRWAQLCPLFQGRAFDLLFSVRLWIFSLPTSPSFPQFIEKLAGKMAELVGVLSAGTGIASFLFQVGMGIERIRKTISYNRHQASVDLESVAADFEKLQEVIKDIQDSRNHALIALAIERCRQMFAEVETELDRLSQIFGYKKSPKNRLISLKTQLMSKAEDNVRNMRKKVQQIMETLLL